MEVQNFGTSEQFHVSRISEPFSAELLFGCASIVARLPENSPHDVLICEIAVGGK